ncbi:hypothetical protein [Chitinophaga sp. ARDCPP14]|uniref:hypothetical protein n=1 Tax=Chitinophaga sp. ARDCPP14 TaxID=3391139 RepID=UPI003F52787C
MPRKYLFTTILFFTALMISCAEHGPAQTSLATTDSIPVTSRPLFRDFMGVNGHLTFKPDLYKQVCRLVRSYHNISWDVKAPGDPITIPNTINNINWKRDAYGPWKEAGFETDICMQFLGVGLGSPNYKQLWAGKEQWAYDYGKAMAAYYGPSGAEKLCTSLEIDNEPGTRFDPALFKTLFTKMADGVRAGDPAMKIVTPAVAVKADPYSQGLNDLYIDKKILPLYDVINVHTYPTIAQSAGNENSWNRSYPEDNSLQYLKVIEDAITWRNQHAKDKEVWVTEFGYDACTPEAMKHRKDWALKLNWQGASDLQQAQYLVRSFLMFATLDIRRAYLYYYNDEDEASFHAASGLTRNFVPKMSFWAVKQLYQTLGDYRFRRVVKKETDSLYVFEFIKGDDPKMLVWVAWSPTGAKTHQQKGYQPHVVNAVLDNLPSLPVSATAMTTADEPAKQVKWEKTGDTAVRLEVGESPVYIMFQTTP